jgi:predicted transcriptional regulator
MEVLTRIQRGCDDIAAGRVISHDEMKRKFLRNKPGDGQK